MDEYEKDVLIDELEKLVVSKTREISIKNYEINQLKQEIERLERLLTPTGEETK